MTSQRSSRNVLICIKNSYTHMVLSNKKYSLISDPFCIKKIRFSFQFVYLEFTLFNKIVSALSKTGDFRICVRLSVHSPSLQPLNTGLELLSGTKKLP